MASRPWVTPQDVKDYTDYKEVAGRTDEKLKVDIVRAEQYIITRCNDDFSEFSELPESVRIAAILLTELYAYNSVEGERSMRSESFDDYSYTLDDRRKPSLDGIGLDTLLDPYKKVKGKGNVTFRMTVI